MRRTKGSEGDQGKGKTLHYYNNKRKGTNFKNLELMRIEETITKIYNW